MNSLLSALSYVPLFELDNSTIIYLFAILLYTSVVVSANNYSLDLCNGDLQTTTVFFIRDFTQDRLNSYWLLLALPCLFMRERSVWWRFLKWNVRGFAFSRILSRLHCCLCIVYTLLIVGFAYLSIPFSLILVVVGLLATSSMYLLV